LNRQSLSSWSFLILSLLPFATSCSDSTEDKKDERRPGQVVKDDINACDIDIRPSKGRGKGPSNFHLEYETLDAQQILKVSADYKGPASAELHGTTPGDKDIKLLDIPEGQNNPITITLDWLDPAGSPKILATVDKMAPVELKVKGTYDKDDTLLLSPAFEEGSSDEWVKVRCQYRGIRTTLIVTKKDS